MLLDKTVFVYALAKDSDDADKDGFIAHNGFSDMRGAATNAVKVNIQPASSETIALSDGIVGKTYDVFTQSSGLTEGMKIVVSGTNDRFVITGRKSYDYGVHIHQELIATRSNEVS